MHRALYLTATGPRTGKRAIALGTMSILSRNMQDVAIFRPIINEPQLDDRAPDINLLLEHFKLKQDYCDTFAYTYQEVRTIINQGDRNLVIENIIQKFKELQSRHDFVLCVGTDFLGKDPVFEFELNAEIASNLGCPVMLITSGEGKSAEEVRDSLLVTRDSMAPYSLDVIATIVNRSSLTRAEADDLSDIFAADDKPGLVYAIPDEPALGRATMRDLQKGLNAEVLSGEAHLDALVGDYLIAAMHVDNFLGYLAKDQLIVTPGDRTDILLASTSNAIVVGFNVRPNEQAQAAAKRDKVDMRMYRVIYDAINEIGDAMKGMLAPKYREVVIGHAEVRQTYKVSSVGTVAGCYVKDGKITRDAQVRVLRDNIVIHEGVLGSLQRFKDSVKEVAQNYECGMSIDKFNDIKEGDIFECFVMEQIKPE